MNQDMMQTILIGILLLCGYFYLYQIVAQRTVNRSSLPFIAVLLLVVYAGISFALITILGQLGNSNTVLLALLVFMSILGLFLLLCGLVKNFRAINKTMLLLFILYMLMTSYMTIFNRRYGEQSDILLHFDSIEEALRLHSVEPLQHLAMNVAMFVPIGFLFPLILPEKLNKLSLVIPLGLMLSTLIETTQMLLRMGQCDLEDLVANTVGAIIGLLLYRMFRGVLPGGKRA